MRKKGRNAINVKLTRIYSYPFSVLNRDNREGDALEKAQVDFQNDIHEALGSNKGLQGFSEAVLTRQLPYALRRPIVDDDQSTLNRRTAAMLVANKIVSRKYGALDAERNPKAFIHEKAVMSDDGKTVICEEEYYLIPEIEQLIHHEYEEFLHLFDTQNTTLE